MRRRALLTSLTVLAGCSSGSPATGHETTATPPGSDSPTDDPNPIPPRSVVRRASIRYFRNDDAVGVDRPGLDQFVYVRVTGGESAQWSDHALRLNDRTVDPVEPRGFMLSVPGTGDYYEGGDGWLVSDVPALSVDEGALVVGSEERPLPRGRSTGSPRRRNRRFSPCRPPTTSRWAETWARLSRSTTAGSARGSSSPGSGAAVTPRR